MEEIRGEEVLNGSISLEPPGSGSLQHLASTYAKRPDCLEDTGIVTQLVTTGATGGQPAEYKHTEDKHILFHSLLRESSIKTKKYK